MVMARAALPCAGLVVEWTVDGSKMERMTLIGDVAIPGNYIETGPSTSIYPPFLLSFPGKRAPARGI
jgi:hypothetical protein